MKKYLRFIYPVVFTCLCLATVAKADPCNPVLWYQDADGDGYGNSDVFVSNCVQPTGYVADSTDCDDTNPNVNPGATEVCNGIDDNCNGVTDNDAIDATLWYADNDGDGYGDKNDPGSYACTQPLNTSADNTDCDDNNIFVYPGATELCNGLDDDCNGTVDDNAADATLWYIDADGDGYGDLTDPGTYACSAPVNHVADNTDCDDSNPDIHPGATEVCNFLDDDCNGTADDNAVDATLWYVDSDTDTYGDQSDPGIYACTQPSGYSGNNLDCDDSNPAVYPGATEICNGVDDDCNGTADDNAVDASIWYVDADDDGYGSAADPGSLSCSQPLNSSANDMDCDDNNAAVYPGATEVCNGVDDDCNGFIDDSPVDGLLFYVDNDGDGYGSVNDAGTIACSAPTGDVADNTDCDDANSAINPGAAEVCNGYDDNCDGLIDDADPFVSGQTLWYIDNDHDGYGDQNDPGTFACNQPAGDAGSATDCDDTNPAVNPGAADICNGIDDDCNGTIDDGCVTAVAAYSSDKMELKVFPNPASSYVDVSVKGPLSSYTLKLTDLNGSVLKNLEEEAAELVHLDLSGISKGIYILYISAAKENRQMRITLE